MNNFKTAPLLLIFFLLPLLAAAQSWTGTLEKGGVVSIDPASNKALLYTDQGATELWDGTHRLQDGSVIIVRNGVVTSGVTQPQATAVPLVTAEDAPLSSSACVELVIKVCGFNGECADQTGCSPARQLMQLEKDEAWQTGSKGPNQTSVQCRSALANEEYFARCNLENLSQNTTPCEQLVANSCGAQDQCSSAPACSPARQLLVMETQERLAERNPNRITYSGRQCKKSLEGSDFFIRCAADDAGSSSETPGSESPPAQFRSADPAHQ